MIDSKENYKFDLGVKGLIWRSFQEEPPKCMDLSW